MNIIALFGKPHQYWIKCLHQNTIFHQLTLTIMVLIVRIYALYVILVIIHSREGTYVLLCNEIVRFCSAKHGFVINLAYQVDETTLGAMIIKLILNKIQSAFHDDVSGYSEKTNLNQYYKTLGFVKYPLDNSIAILTCLFFRVV